MKDTRFSFATWLAILVITLIPWPLRAALSLADIPLFLTTAVEPNVIFTLDDSGSMQWEIMPDEKMKGSTYYVYPRVSKVYGGTDYTNRVVGFDADDKYAATLRSSQVNKIYYDPTVRYRPWWDESIKKLMPDANPECALHNPVLDKGCRNLTKNNKQKARWLVNGSLTNEIEKTFYPATYFQYKGSGSINSASSYDRIEIKSGKTYTGSEERTDCAAAPVCTYTEEIQNFANWYTYYRSRILLARAGVGHAFSTQGKNMRVAFGAINKDSSKVDGVSTDTVISGVRLFDGDNRLDFFNQLYNHEMPAKGTPLRKAMVGVGEYLKGSDAKGPWGDNPGVGGGSQAVCRQNYHILMTDGYWDGNDSVSVGNADGTAGVTHINHSQNAVPANYKYQPSAPYSDSYSNTLADIAMHYWKNDLRTDLLNKVPTNSRDPAFWQHMVNFTVGLGVEGTLTTLPSNSGGWPNPTSSDPAKIDDLWHAAVNSRGEFFSAQNPKTFADGLARALTNMTARVSSAAAVTTNTSRLNTGAQVYQAKFNSADWSGALLAFNLESDASVGELQWEASEQLPQHQNRSIFTHNGTSSLVFLTENFSLLSESQKAALNTNLSGVSDNKGHDRVAWLRGDKSKEVAAGGIFRNRNNGLLGDIVNSDLLFVKALDFGYDALPSGTQGKDTYYSYVQANNQRVPAIYTGANDGMLHAFHAETGKELFAYIPSAIYSDLSRLTSPDYNAAHRYLVDGNAYAGDAYIDGAWKTILLGTLGGGGKSIFALDVTDPMNFSTQNVLWEFSDPDLGLVHGQAKIARLNDGSWAAVFGNGYNSSSDQAYLFVVDLKTGELIKKITAGTQNQNGLSTPALVDIDGDKIIDIVYAGDLQGNVWKFDLSSSTVESWGSLFKSGSDDSPLFTARNSDNQVQSITSPLEIGRHKQGGYMVYFGTGRFVANGDASDTKVQSLYGIWDKGTRIVETNRSVLQEQTINPASNPPLKGNERTVTDNPVDWETKRGWYIDLPQFAGEPSERSVIQPMLNFGRVIFTTLTPSDDPCEAGGRNWLMLLNAETGGMMSPPQFDTNDDGKLDNNDRVIAGVGSDGIRSESVAISAGSLTHLIAATTTGAVEKVTIRNGAPPPRRSWKQIQ